MKKMHVGILFGIFAVTSFLAMNLYTATSFPGYGGSEACNNCHNQPIMVKNVDASFQLGDWAASKAVFDNNGQWATNEVPVIETNNRSEPIEFIKTVMLQNSTHFMMMQEIEDTTPTNSTTSTTVNSDKFAVIFNIDEDNFTVGDFLTYYNSTSGTPLDQVLTGQMGFADDGTADLWWIDTATTNYNTTGTAMDYYIGTNYNSDGSTHQEVHFALWYGVLAVHGTHVVHGYRLWFVRTLTTSDAHDVQFNTQGVGIRYAIATWDGTANEYHHSSFDQMIILGDSIGVHVVSTVTSNVTQTQTVNNNVTSTVTVTGTSTPSGTTSSFTVVFVLAALAISIPVISRYKRRKE